MEEEKKKETKLTYEQLENVAIQLQQRLMTAENKLKTIDFASVRLTWLFKVIENKEQFSPVFVEKCTTEVENLLTIEEDPKEESDKA